MHLQRIEASNFRNLIGEVEFSPGLNVIYGANAQGKTNSSCVAWSRAAI
jgi:recombinational DNA repair ATPase RecF